MRDRILHLADLHLGDPHDYLGALSANRRQEADRVLTRITDHVLDSDSRIGGVIIAGDLFDHYDPAETLVQSVLTDLERLRAAGIRILTVPGNHDEYSYPDCVYRRQGARWPDTLVVSPTPEKIVTWDLCGTELDLYAMAYVAGRTRGRCDQFAIEPNERLKIAVIHGSLDAPWSDRSVPLKSDALKGLGLDYVALGHIHVAKSQRLGNGWVVYPGRIEGGGFDDPGGAGLIEIEIRRGALRPVEVPFSSRRIETVSWNVSGMHSIEEIEERLEHESGLESGLDSGLGSEHGKDRILRVALEGMAGFVLDQERIARFGAERFFHFDLKTPDDKTGADPIDEVLAEPTVRGQFVRLAQERIAGIEPEEERRTAEAALRFGLAAFSAAGVSNNPPGDQDR